MSDSPKVDGAGHQPLINRPITQYLAPTLVFFGVIGLQHLLNKRYPQFVPNRLIKQIEIAGGAAFVISSVLTKLSHSQMTKQIQALNKKSSADQKKLKALLGKKGTIAKLSKKINGFKLWYDQNHLALENLIGLKTTKGSVAYLSNKMAELTQSLSGSSQSKSTNGVTTIPSNISTQITTLSSQMKTVLPLLSQVTALEGSPKDNNLGRVGTNEKDIKTNKEELVKVKRRLDTVETKLTTLGKLVGDKNTGLRKDVKDLLGRLNGLTADTVGTVPVLKKQLIELDKQLEILSNKKGTGVVDRLQNRVKNLETAINNATNGLKKQVNDLITTVNSLVKGDKARIPNIENDVKTLQTIVDGLTNPDKKSGRVDRVEAAIKIVTTLKASLSTLTTTVTGEKDGYGTQITKIQSAVKALLKGLTDLKGTVSMHNNSIKQLLLVNNPKKQSKIVRRKSFGDLSSLSGSDTSGNAPNLLNSSPTTGPNVTTNTNIVQPNNGNNTNILGEKNKYDLLYGRLIESPLLKNKTGFTRQSLGEFVTYKSQNLSSDNNNLLSQFNSVDDFPYDELDTYMQQHGSKKQ